MLSRLVVAMMCIVAAPTASATDVPEFVTAVFRQGVVTMPLAQASAPVSAGSFSSFPVIAFLLSHGVTTIEREWPGFDPATDLTGIARTGELVDMIDFSEHYRFTLPSGSTAADYEQFAGSLEAMYECLLTDLSYPPTTSLTCPPGQEDPEFVHQWYLENTGGTFDCSGVTENAGTAGFDINVGPAWDISTGSSDVTAVVFDESFPTDVHPDFGDRILSWDGTLYSREHGVKVASVLAAAGCNGIGIKGVDWNVSLHSRRFSTLAEKIRNIVTVDMAELSNHSYAWRYNTGSRAAFRDNYLRNHVTIAATGNSKCSDPNDTFEHGETYPASYRGPGVISVGGIGVDGNINWTAHGPSCHHHTLDLVAPSEKIVNISADTTTGQPKVGCNNGTSVAAPQVSGVVSLMLSMEPDLYNDDIEHLIKRAADNIVVPGEHPVTGEDDLTGAGLLNAARSLEYLEYPWIIDRGETIGGTVAFFGTPRYKSHIYGSPYVEDGEEKWVVRKAVTSDYVTWDPVFANPRAWGRGVASTGVSIDESPTYTNGDPRTPINYSINWCEAQTPEGPGTRFYSYIYEIYDDQFSTTPIGTIPDTDPATGTPVADWVFAYTLHAMGDAPPPAGRQMAQEPSLVASLTGKSVLVKFELSERSDVDVRVHDATGRFVKRLSRQSLGIGGHRLRWDTRNASGQNVGAGVYFVVADIGGVTSSAKVVVSR